MNEYAQRAPVDSIADNDERGKLRIEQYVQMCCRIINKYKHKMCSCCPRISRILRNNRTYIKETCLDH